MESSCIAAFATLLTPLSGLAGVIYVMMRTRMRKLEKTNAEFAALLLKDGHQHEMVVEKYAEIIIRAQQGE